MMNAPPLDDDAARLSATDPSGSYIVQAPAGSGKTETLTQRFLRLLATVDAPEEIIALTFTRKAANEMRDRILLALETTLPATSKHQATTQTYAQKARQRDAQLGWDLLAQPSRLRIMTIDAFCQMLSHAIPLEGPHLHYAALSDKPAAIYLKAAEACFRYALETPDYQHALHIILSHLDNRQDSLIQLFQALLANREQWLCLIYEVRAEDKTVLEEAIAEIIQHAHARFALSLPTKTAHALHELVRHFIDVRGKPSSLQDWHTWSTLNQNQCQELVDLLFTTQATLRKSFDHHVGLKRGECRDEQYDWLKQTSKTLLATLAEYPDFQDSLLRLNRLPSPQYSEKQWAVLQALFQLLPLLVAHLNHLFMTENAIDFIGIAEQALLAFGEEQSPTDLALYLDNRIQHILVDEFQDTSIQQFQLLTRLVQEWTPQDGRTLFIVGDPMQSIYRFRAAEVGLFLRAQEEGIGSVALTPLAFTTNFRSSQILVQWVNQHFPSIFPKKADMASGAITFHPSVPIKESDKTSFITAIEWDNRLAEAAGMVDIIQQELDTYPEATIAILVRSRHQLTHLIDALHTAGIPFQGVDIERLAHLPHVRDVWSLTQALLMPQHRLAWLSVLRSPWCGLSLHDLEAIAAYAPTRSIAFTLSELSKITALSADGLHRAKTVGDILQEALDTRCRLSVVDWVMNTLEALHVQHILTPSQYDDLEQFWMLLARFEEHSQIQDIARLQTALENLYSQRVVAARLQIMTIHKSKGLEFDCVMLPGLGMPSSARDAPLFRWLKLPMAHQEPLLLLSPIQAASEETDRLYRYLGDIDAEKEHYELQRLFYVAATRAKRRLYLFDNSQTARNKTFRAFLRHQSFTSICTEANVEAASPLPKRHALPISFYTPSHAKITTHSIQSPQITPSLQRLIGIVAHDLLHWIGTAHPTTFADIPWPLAEQHLLALGFMGDVLKDAMAALKQSFEALFQDPIGRWIIAPHKDEQNEYAILTGQAENMRTRIIDRTFVADKIRWIIDFKTGHAHVDAMARHREQVEAYARLFAANSPYPIHCGLYYLATTEWKTWPFMQCESVANVT